MSEQFRESIESNEYYTYVNGRDIIHQAETQYWLADVNQELLLADHDRIEDIIDEASDEFEDVLPSGSGVAFSDCIANAYPVQKNGKVEREPQLYVLDDMEYQGLDWHDFKKGIPEVVLRFQESDNGRDDESRRVFYVRPVPEDLEVFELALFDTEHEDAAVDLLQHSAAQMSILLLSAEFNAAPVHEKTEMLREALEKIEYCLSQTIPENADSLGVVTSRYYTIPDGLTVAEQDLELFLSSNADTPSILEGSHINVMIPEFSEVEVNDWRSFAVSGGVPHIALQNYDKECTYWIPIDAITAMPYSTEGTEE